MKKLLFIFGIAAAHCIAQTSAAPSTANPLVSSGKAIYGISKNDVLKSAEEMPEANYSFKPVDTVRSFGELVGHVADAQYEFCSVVLADGKKAPEIEKTKTSKTDLTQALKDAFAYCDSAFSSLTDARAADIVKFGPFTTTKLAVLDFSTAHNMEHYGNMTTYLRMKGLVPPSSKH